MKQFFVFIFLLNTLLLVSQQKTNSSENTMRQSGGTLNNNQATDEFNDFINLFIDFQTDQLTNKSFTPLRHELKENMVRLFIDENFRFNFKENYLWFRPIAKIETKDHVIAFILKNREMRSTEIGYPFSEIVLNVYSRDGKIIDGATFGKEGDFWKADLNGIREPFQLIVKQADIIEEDYDSRSPSHPCRIETHSYSISGKGMIEKEFVSSNTGLTVWNERLHKYEIIDNIVN